MHNLYPRLGCFMFGALFSVGCATAYTPQSNGRIAVVSDGFGPQFARDGVMYRAGPFGGDIDKAVAGNPRAEAEAAKYQTGQTTGTILTFVGLAGVLGGLLMYSPSYTATGSDRNTTAVGVTLGGLVVEIVGVIVTISSRSHLWDAINMFNDDVSVRQDEPSPCRPLPSGTTPLSP